VVDPKHLVLRIDHASRSGGRPQVGGEPLA
jgi:hypothetical protein